MFKRRLATIVTATALGLGGMATAALADHGPVERPDSPVRVHGPEERVRYSGELTCWMDGGRSVRFSKAKVAEFIEDEYIEPELAETVMVDGVAVVPEDRLSISVPARELPRHVRKVKGKRWHHGRVIHLTCVWNGR